MGNRGWEVGTMQVIGRGIYVVMRQFESDQCASVSLPSQLAIGVTGGTSSPELLLRVDEPFLNKNH